MHIIRGGKNDAVIQTWNKETIYKYIMGVYKYIIWRQFLLLVLKL